MINSTIKPQVYLDSNILIDWFDERGEFAVQATLIIDMVETGEIIGCVSPLAIANAHYMIRKSKGKAGTRNFLEKIQQILTFIDNSAHALTQAIDEPYKDFEDDLHFYSALENGITTFVTRNPKDFPTDKAIQILTPDELLYELGY